MGPPSSKELFVGMVRHDDAMAYFDKVRFHIARNWDWSISPWNVSLEIDEMVQFNGTAKPQPPKEATIWVASAWGEQTAIMNWTLERGTYWVAVMNADGSPDVEASVELGARFPILGKLFITMLIFGLVLGVGGTLLIYFGYMRRR